MLKTSLCFGPYFNSLKHKYETRNASSFVGESVAIITADKLLLHTHKSKMGWSETHRCVLGVTCNKPISHPL